MDIGTNPKCRCDEEFKNAQTAGGYAKEMSKEYQAKQAALVAACTDWGGKGRRDVWKLTPPAEARNATGSRRCARQTAT
jgi:hypothetical protein